MKIHDIERLKAYSMVDLASYYGIKLRLFAGKATGCCGLPGHRDKTPSFSITVALNLGTCWGCEFRGDNFDLVGAMEGISGFHRKACRLEEITGIPQLVDARTPFEKDLERRANALAAAFSQDVADWSHGVQMFAESHKRRLGKAMDWASTNGAEDLSQSLGRAIERVPRSALTPGTADPRLIANAYRNALSTARQAADRVRQAGRDDRQDAERVTWAIVDLIAAAQQKTERA
jgi:hypothetical protein